MLSRVSAVVQMIFTGQRAQNPFRIVGDQSIAPSILAGSTPEPLRLRLKKRPKVGRLWRRVATTVDGSVNFPPDRCCNARAEDSGRHFSPAGTPRFRIRGSLPLDISQAIVSLHINVAVSRF